jgi:pimeloyl-ACP methyl ester carboxylesterase
VIRALIAIQGRLANDMTHAIDETDMSGDKGLCVETVRRFEHNTGGIDWYCEQRGEGPPVVLVPSGEGDCASFEEVAAHLANDFTVLTFDMPGFSRSHVRSPDDVSVPKLADQIADLVESLKLCPATFYGCSSGGFAVLDLVVRHPNVVQTAIVHEVADAAAAAPLLSLTALDDAAIVETCKFAYGQILNDDLAAWEALGDEYHARLAKNYVTWVRRYLSPPLPPSHSPDDLAGKPITWTVGGVTPAATFFENVVLAVKSGLPISLLMCKHFPQVSAPAMLAEHIRNNSLAN